MRSCSDDSAFRYESHRIEISKPHLSTSLERKSLRESEAEERSNELLVEEMSKYGCGVDVNKEQRRDVCKQGKEMSNVQVHMHPFLRLSQSLSLSLGLFIFHENFINHKAVGLLVPLRFSATH